MVKSCYTYRVILLLFWVLGSMGCGGERRQAIEDAPLISIRIPDENGGEMRFRDPPVRIVSLSPSMTEIVFALGEQSRLAGVSQSCDYPDAARLYQQITTFPEIDRESILALNPDCILATADIFSPAQALWFRQQGIPVVYQAYPDLSSVWKGIGHIARLCGSRPEALAVVDSLVKVAQGIQERPRAAGSVAILVNSAPLMIAGGQGFLNDLIHAAGGKNIGSAFKRDYVETDAEFLMKENPDFLVVPARDDYEALAFLEQHPRLSAMGAVAGKRIFRVDPSVFLRPGPRSLQALMEMRSILQPGEKDE